MEKRGSHSGCTLSEIGQIVKLYCCGCGEEVEARLTDGAEIYPHRPDLNHPAPRPYWRCDACGNYVGCHWKTEDRTRPLGNIPTAELREARRKIHELLDSLWEQGTLRRSFIYNALSEALGYPYHTGEIRTIEEARRVYKAVLEIRPRLDKT